MAKISDYFSSRTPIHRQIALMKQHAHNFQLVSWDRGTARWQADVTPTVLSTTYKVEVAYHLGSRPVVRVLRPEILPRGRTQPPHTYRDGSLCLYYPLRDEWTSSLPIATYIVPWISLWLFYYEIWRLTGDWLGGGTHDVNPEE